MSQENVEVVRRIYSRWNAGDPGFDFYAADIEWDVSRYAPDLPNVAKGHEQVRTLFRRFLGMWEDLHFELERLTVARADTVIAEVTVHSRGRGSGVPVADRVAHVFTLRDGLVMRHVQHRSNAEALENMGLSDWAMSQENIELLRAALEAYNAGDMDALRERYDPDAMIVRGLDGWPETGPVVGRDAVMRYFEQLRETWDSDSLEPTSDFIGVGARVVVRHVWRGVGRGPESKMEWTVVYTFRDGRVVPMEYFWDHAEALETLGLSE